MFLYKKIHNTNVKYLSDLLNQEYIDEELI